LGSQQVQGRVHLQKDDLTKGTIKEYVLIGLIKKIAGEFQRAEVPI